MSKINKAIHCIGCEQGLTVIPDDEVIARLTKLSGWQYDVLAKRISKVFQFKGFMRTMSFVNAIAWIANQENHHPDLEVSYDTCKVSYQTHAVHGVTENDLICAQKIEAL